MNTAWPKRSNCFEIVSQARFYKNLTVLRGYALLKPACVYTSGLTCLTSKTRCCPVAFGFEDRANIR